MSTEYRNKMLEEFEEDENSLQAEAQKMDFSGKIVHCSQFQARNFLYQVGFRGISNNQKMQRLFRFALAAYDYGMFIGTAMVFLDIESPVVAFATVSTKQIEVGGKFLESIEAICKIMGFQTVKLTAKGLTKEFIRVVDLKRDKSEHYTEGKGCYVKQLY